MSCFSTFVEHLTYFEFNHLYLVALVFSVFISWAEAEASNGGDELSETQLGNDASISGAEDQRPGERESEGLPTVSLFKSNIACEQIDVYFILLDGLV